MHGVVCSSCVREGNKEVGDGVNERDINLHFICHDITEVSSEH